MAFPAFLARPYISIASVQNNVHPACRPFFDYCKQVSAYLFCVSSLFCDLTTLDPCSKKYKKTKRDISETLRLTSAVFQSEKVRTKSEKQEKQGSKQHSDTPTWRPSRSKKGRKSRHTTAGPQLKHGQSPRHSMHQSKICPFKTACGRGIC